MLLVCADVLHYKDVTVACERQTKLLSKRPGADVKLSLVSAARCPESTESVSSPRSIWPDSPGLEPLWPDRSHLTDVVVDGVCVPLARWVAHRLEHAVFVSVHLRHRHVDAVGVVVRSLRAVRRNRLEGKHTGHQQVYRLQKYQKEAQILYQFIRKCINTSAELKYISYQIL